MEPAEAGLWFFIEFLIIPFTIPASVFWVMWTWWIYAVWIFYEIFLAFEHFNVAEKTEEDIGMKENTRKHYRREDQK